MADYPMVPLGELASPESGSIAIGPFGSRMKADTYTTRGIPVVRGVNIWSGRSLVGDWVFVSEEFARQIPNCIAWPGDLVLPHRGSIGEVALIGPEHEKVVLSSSMMKFRPNAERADSEFVYYFLKSEAGRNEILRFASQVGTPGIGQPLTSLRQVRIPLPPLVTQRAIGRTLSTLDDKIELNRRMNETLEAMAQAIFRDWFVDFGPTRRKLAGITDPVEIMGGLLQNGARAAELAAQFPDALGDNGLPQGWQPATVAELFDVNPTEALKRGTLAPYTDMAALPTSGSTADAPIEREFGSGMRFRNGDALLARITPCLENGKAAFVDFLPDDQTVGWGSTEFVVFRARHPVPKPMAYLLVRHPEFRSLAIQSMTGTSGRQRAQSDTLCSFDLPLPTTEVFEQFGELVPAIRID